MDSDYTLNIVRDVHRCKELWGTYIPKKVLWDEWEICECFYDKKIHQLQFFEIFQNNISIGVLPLWDDVKKGITFFGGFYPENRGWYFPKEALPFIWHQLPKKSCFAYITKKAYDDFQEQLPGASDAFLELEGYRYYLDLNSIRHNLDNYLATFSKKHRKNLRYDLKQAENRGLEKQWETTEHFEEMVELSNKRFGKDSDYASPLHTKALKSILEMMNAKRNVYTLTITHQEKIVGISTSVIHNHIYYILTLITDSTVKSIGKLLVMEQLHKAISLQAKEIDLLAGDTHSEWKELWNFQKEPYYSITKT
ncbi:MAG: GNAT family N-acetyltransferase [Nanoarchaeota archaeon]|nr:GNAT family N-acetyltransferase [Nanoarchaeota archaeon]